MRPSSFRVALAALLVLAQLLAPFAHRPAGAASAPWLDVCTSDGLRRLPTDGGPPPPGHEGDHCVLCRVAGSPAGAPPAVFRFLPAPAIFVAAASPAVVTTGAPTRFDAPARAPPRAG